MNPMSYLNRLSGNGWSVSRVRVECEQSKVECL